MQVCKYASSTFEALKRAYGCGPNIAYRDAMEYRTSIFAGGYRQVRLRQGRVLAHLKVTVPMHGQAATRPLPATLPPHMYQSTYVPYLALPTESSFTSRAAL